MALADSDKDLARGRLNLLMAKLRADAAELDRSEYAKPELVGALDAVIIAMQAVSDRIDSRRQEP